MPTLLPKPKRENLTGRTVPRSAVREVQGPLEVAATITLEHSMLLQHGNQYLFFNGLIRIPLGTISITLSSLSTSAAYMHLCFERPGDGV